MQHRWFSDERNCPSCFVLIIQEMCKHTKKMPRRWLVGVFPYRPYRFPYRSSDNFRFWCEAFAYACTCHIRVFSLNLVLGGCPCILRRKPNAGLFEMRCRILGTESGRFRSRISSSESSSSSSSESMSALRSRGHHPSGPALPCTKTNEDQAEI